MELIPFHNASYLAQVRRLRAMAEQVITAYPIRVARIDFIQHGENATFSVHAKSGERYLCRIHRANYHTRGAISEELQWLIRLAKSETQVPEPIKSRNGNFIEVASTDLVGTRLCVVFKWVDGKFIRSSMTAERAASAGALLARIQNQGRNKKMLHRCYWDAEGLVGDAPKFGWFDRLPGISNEKQKSLNATKEALLKRLRNFERRYPSRLGLIHADLHFGNILVTKSNELGAIDFDDCGYGFYGYDLTAPIVSIEQKLRIGRRLKSFPKMLDALFEGYASETRFDSVDFKQMGDFVLARKLVIIGWLSSRADNPRLAKYLKKSVERALDYIESPYL